MLIKMNGRNNVISLEANGVVVFYQTEWNQYYGPSSEVEEVCEYEALKVGTRNESEAQQRAALLIWAIEEEFVHVEDLNG